MSPFVHVQDMIFTCNQITYKRKLPLKQQLSHTSPSAYKFMTEYVEQQTFIEDYHQKMEGTTCQKKYNHV